MKEKIMKVLDDVADSQLNLKSKQARETLANLITSVLSTDRKVEKKKDWPGLDTIMLTDDSEVIEVDSSRARLVEQAYREITSDGLPQGGDVEAMKLAEAIVDDMEGDYMYESNDGGKTIYKRPVGNYSSEGKVKLTSEEWEQIKARNENRN
tara:strand:- start:813 stop:1268 length:456 start_codon:yes stop_codon:yes gene_type:complete